MWLWRVSMVGTFCRLHGELRAMNCRKEERTELARISGIADMLHSLSHPGLSIRECNQSPCDQLRNTPDYEAFTFSLSQRAETAERQLADLHPSCTVCGQPMRPKEFVCECGSSSGLQEAGLERQLTEAKAEINELRNRLRITVDFLRYAWPKVKATDSDHTEAAKVIGDALWALAQREERHAERKLPEARRAEIERLRAKLATFKASDHLWESCPCDMCVRLRAELAQKEERS